MDHDPCVAPDESFLVFASDRPGGFGGNDLYVSSPSPSGGWDEPINLGPGVNSEFEDARPVLSSDGEMLFFTRQSAAGMDVYRVPSSVVTWVDDGVERPLIVDPAEADVPAPIR
jgi:hypothetical protein